VPPISAPILPDDPEAALIAAEAEITRRYEWLHQHRATLRPQDQREDEDRVQKPVYDAIERLEDFITNTPTKTLAGAAVKLRRVLDATVGIDTGAHSGDATSLAHVLAMVQSITGTPTHPTRPTFTPGQDDEPALREPPFDVSVPAPTPGSDEALLIAEQRRVKLCAWSEARETADVESDALGDLNRALEDFIAETPAVGPTAIAVKFERLYEHASAETNTAWGAPLRRTILDALDRLGKGGAA